MVNKLKMVQETVHSGYCQIIWMIAEEVEKLESQ
jgi:hypothetical protein